MSPTNYASVLTGAKKPGNYLQVKEVPYPKYSPDQVVIKAKAYAVNPTDWKHALMPSAVAGSVSGSDVSGVVHAVGANVKGIAVGDVVSGVSFGNTPQSAGAWSDYALVDRNAIIKYSNQFKDSPLAPGDYPPGPIDTFEGAASFTLSYGTVIYSFANGFKLENDKAKNHGKWILIWGGTTATGFIAIQAAKLFGLKVVTTASKKHHAELKALGADAVVDYKDKDAAEQIKKLTGSSVPYAFDTIGSVDTRQGILDGTDGTDNTIVDTLIFYPQDKPKIRQGRTITWANTLLYLINGKPKAFGEVVIPANPAAAKAYNEAFTNVFPPIQKEFKHIGLKVLAHGLESGNDAFQASRDGVSSQKVVFSNKSW